MDETQTQEPPKNNTTKALIAIVGLIVIVAVAIFAFQAVSSENTTTQETQQTTNQETTTQNQDAQEATTQESSYQDGNYEAVGRYITPGGAQEVGVTVTLAGGIIEDVEIDRLGTLPTSKEKQADFDANYKTFVVGKNIDEVELTKVSGSSLTPKGFNDALSQIKEEASS